MTTTATMKTSGSSRRSQPALMLAVLRAMFIQVSIDFCAIITRFTTLLAERKKHGTQLIVLTEGGEGEPAGERPKRRVNERNAFALRAGDSNATD